LSNHNVKKKDLARAQAAGIEWLKALVSHHNLTVTRKSRSWQAFRQGVSDHVVCTERNKLDKTSKGKFPDIVSTNVDVSGVFTTDWIDGHSHSR
jgi:hypothetical protein